MQCNKRNFNYIAGVAFTRNPATGEKEFYGEYLNNAEGEDVVAGYLCDYYIALYCIIAYFYRYPYSNESD